MRRGRKRATTRTTRRERSPFRHVMREGRPLVWWLLFVGLCCSLLTGCPNRTTIKKTPVQVVKHTPKPRPRPRARAPRRRPPPVRTTRVVKAKPKSPAARPLPFSQIKAARKSKRRAGSTYYSVNAYKYYLRARLHAVEDRPKKAIKAFLYALSHHRKSIYLRYCIARQYLKLNQYKNATLWAKDAVRLSPRYAPAHHLLGRIAWGQKKPLDAIRHYQRALRANPKQAESYIALSGAMIQSRQSASRRKRLLKRMIRYLPNRYEGYYQLALLYQEQGKSKLALKSFRKALNRNPSHHPSLYQVARLHEAKKRYKKAIRSYQVLLDYQPNSWQTRITLACLYFKRNAAHDKELASYQLSYIMREATRVLSWERAYQIGSGLYNCKLFPQSLAWLQRSLQLNPNYAAAHLTIGIVYLKASKPSVSLRHFRAIPPKSKGLYTEAQLYLIQTLLQLNQPQKAWLALESARIQLARRTGEWIRLSQLFAERAPKNLLVQEEKQIKQQLKQQPTHKGLMHLASYISFQRGHYDECEKTLQKLLKLDKNHTPALNFLGYVYAIQRKRLSRAERLIKRALKLDPDNASYLDSLGWVYHQQARYGLARRYLERANKQIPHDATIIVHLALTYQRLRLYKRSLRLFKKAGKLKPSPQLQKKIDFALKELSRRSSSQTRSRNPA